MGSQFGDSIEVSFDSHIGLAPMEYFTTGGQMSHKFNSLHPNTNTHYTHRIMLS